MPRVLANTDAKSFSSQSKLSNHVWQSRVAFFHSTKQCTSQCFLQNYLTLSHENNHKINPRQGSSRVRRLATTASLAPSRRALVRSRTREPVHTRLRRTNNLNKKSEPEKERETTDNTMQLQIDKDTTYTRRTARYSNNQSVAAHSSQLGLWTRLGGVLEGYCARGALGCQCSRELAGPSLRRSGAGRSAAGGGPAAALPLAGAGPSRPNGEGAGRRRAPLVPSAQRDRDRIEPPFIGIARAHPQPPELRRARGSQPGSPLCAHLFSPGDRAIPEIYAPKRGRAQMIAHFFSLFSAPCAAKELHRDAPTAEYVERVRR